MAWQGEDSARRDLPRAPTCIGAAHGSSTDDNLFVLLLGDHSLRLQEEYPLVGCCIYVEVVGSGPDRPWPYEQRGGRRCRRNPGGAPRWLERPRCSAASSEAIHPQSRPPTTTQEHTREITRAGRFRSGPSLRSNTGALLMMRPRRPT